MHIRKEILEYIIQEVYNDEDYEICGNFELDDTTNELKILYTVKGTYDAVKRANMCNYTDKYASNYLYHTHPYTSYAYPSFYDIWTVVKRRNQKNIHFTSFIFTIWGLWLLVPVGDMYVDEKLHDELKKTFSSKIIEFHASQTSNSGITKSKEYTPELYELIINYIKAVQEVFAGLVIVKFIPMETLEKMESDLLKN